MYYCSSKHIIHKFFLRVLSKLLVEVGGANIDIQDAKGRTPAMLAKEMNQSYVVNYLNRF